MAIDTSPKTMLPAVPTADLGPKMRALKNDNMRAFVMAYVQNGGNAVQACDTAGYLGRNMTGWRLLQRADIQEAMAELLTKEVTGLTPSAVKAMERLLHDPNHKDHAKAVFGVLDRTGFHAKSEHKTVVEHSVSDDQLIGAIKSLAAELGFNDLEQAKLVGQSPRRHPKPKVVDAVAVEVADDGSAGLEDLLG